MKLEDHRINYIAVNIDSYFSYIQVMKVYIKISILVLFIFLNNHSRAQNPIEECWAYRDSAVRETNGVLSLKYSLKMLNIAKNIGNDTLIAQSYIELYHDYSRLGNYTQALKFALAAADYYKKYERNGEDYKMLGLIYNLIASAYSNKNDNENALFYLRKAISFDLNTDYKPLLSGHYTGMGEVYRQIEVFDSALHYFLMADSILKTINSNPYRLALSDCNMGLAYLGLNNYAKSDSLLHLSFDYFIQNENYYPVCISYYEIAKKAFENGNVSKAQKYANMAIDMALLNNITDQARNVYLLLSELAIQNKQYQQANTYLSKHYQYKDSLVNNKVVGQMAEQRAEFEIGRKQDEVDHFKDISKARTTIAYILSIGLILIVGLALFLYRANKKRKEVNVQLFDKNIKLNQALTDKDMLMKEIHHRVKNNLQIISSIMNLQSMRINNDEILEIFNEMQRRIMAISSIHQKLYKGDSVSQINMKEYIEEVVNAIHIAFNNQELNVNYEIMVQNVELNIDSAVSIGLIVNELATNSYKYAFTPGKQNHFVVGLNSFEKGSELIIRDNGPGIPDGIDIQNSNSLGLRMVNLLTRQRKGTLNIKSDNGLMYTLFFEGMKAE